ncbi:MAG TPA: hypothetical protein VL251_05640 [Thermomonas sp.]|nr:hypothetical protein [Thermomonas sp.]
MKPNDQASPIDDARWRAQELARRGDPGADPLDLRVARALRRPPAVALPPGFAAQVAARARAQAAGPDVEARLLRALVAAFALSAAVVVAWFGRGWVAGLVQVLPGGREALGWCALAALCLLGNWALGALRRRVAPGAAAAGA